MDVWRPTTRVNIPYEVESLRKPIQLTCYLSRSYITKYLAIVVGYVQCIYKRRSSNLCLDEHYVLSATQVERHSSSRYMIKYHNTSHSVSQLVYITVHPILCHSWFISQYIPFCVTVRLYHSTSHSVSQLVYITVHPILCHSWFISQCITFCVTVGLYHSASHSVSQLVFKNV